MDKTKRRNLFFMLMVGIFVLLVGVMGFTRSPEVTDMVMLGAGLVMTGVSAYRLFIEPGK